MAYDEELAGRVREIMEDEDGLAEQKMFGGLGFLIDGNMAVGASGQGGLLLRVDPARTEGLVTEPGAEPFVMRGRPMTGWLRVDGPAVASAEDLQRWVAIGVAYARSLPPK